MADIKVLISVIIPVYKVEAYLDRCLESVVNQTYRDLEIILVDDGSPDRCPRMCDEWAKQDGRIRVIHKENGGAAQARNAGMREAHGEYIGFVDSDDWIEPQFYEILLESAQTNKCNIVECRLECYTDEESVKHYTGEEFQTRLFSTEDALREIILERQFHQTPVNKLYKAELARSIAFPEGQICEDEVWTYQVLGKGKKLASLDVVLYHYFQSAGSVMRQDYSLKRLACVSAFEGRMEYMRQHFPSLYPLACKSYLSACFFHYQMLCRYPYVDPDGTERQNLHRRFLQGDFSLLLSQANAKYKLWYRLFRFFPTFTCKIRNLLNIGL